MVDLDMKEYGIVELKNDTTMELIKENAPWILKANLENAVLSWNYEFKKLVWHNGSFLGGVWEDGVFMCGTFTNSVWKAGVWHDGIFEYSLWFKGDYFNGLFYDSKWFYGRFMCGVVENSILINGKFTMCEIYDSVLFSYCECSKKTVYV